MRKKRLLTVGLMGITLIAGCGAKFNINASDLESYSEENNAIYVDMSNNYTSDYEYIDGVYILEKDDVHVELWDLDTTENAASWFANNVNILKEDSKSNVGSNTKISGDYTITTDVAVYRVLFLNDKGIYAYGDSKDSVNQILNDLGVK